VLLSIQGGSDLGLFEINEAAQLVSNSAAPEANIIFGAVIDDALGDEVRVTVIAAGFDEAGNRHARLARMSGGTGGPAVGGDGRGSSLRPHPFPGDTSDLVALADGPAGSPAAAAGAGSLGAGGPAAPVTGAGGASTARDGHGPDGDGVAARGPDAHGPDGPGRPAPAQDGEGGDGIPPPRTAGTSRGAAGQAPPARGFDGATTRRRSVVFDEDDDLDVPDFLK
jgi:cell division protein FtsZ